MADLKPSTKEIKAAWMLRKRAEASATGFCGRCYKVRPDVGYKVCRPCQASINEYRKRRHILKRRRAELQHVLEAHERKGDAAREHHLYEEAALYYQNALNVQAIDATEFLRIAEKRANVLYFSGDPSAANRWLEHALPSYLRHLGATPKAVELLLQQAQQLWIESKNEESLSLLQQAVHIAEGLENQRLYKIANLRMAIRLNRLGRYNDAVEHLNAVGELQEHDDAALRATYHNAHATVAASFGKAREAYRHFESAARAAEGDADVHRMISVWENQGLYALAFGDIDIAKICLERALLIARQYQIVWEISHICLNYADILAKMGDYVAARGYLLEALSSTASAPAIDEAIAAIGIPLALRLHDEALLTRCARPSALQSVFNSKAPEVIGAIASSFAELYFARGEVKKARVLLQRALGEVQRVDFAWDLPLGVAQYGAIADIQRARRLLEIRANMLAPKVARAYLALFDALAAQRRKQGTQAQLHAKEAVAQFGALHWYGYADDARLLLSSTRDIRSEGIRESKPFSSIQPALTSREQQVAELVLKGMSNRAIAAALSISERTVEVHMTSIMSRLGVRSRYQLVDHIAHGQSAHTGFHDA